MVFPARLYAGRQIRLMKVLLSLRPSQKSPARRRAGLLLFHLAVERRDHFCPSALILHGSQSSITHRGLSQKEAPLFGGASCGTASVHETHGKRCIILRQNRLRRNERPRRRAALRRCGRGRQCGVVSRSLPSTPSRPARLRSARRAWHGGATSAPAPTGSILVCDRICPGCPERFAPCRRSPRRRGAPADGGA